MGDKKDTRHRIVSVTADLLSREGRDAVTTRAVSAAAGVQPPTIYRLFGDMRGLLEAVAADGFERYLDSKLAQEGSGDAVDDLRAGWDLHVRFGLENPAHYVLMYDTGSPRGEGGAAHRSHELLLGLVRRVAASGRLAVDAEEAAGTIHAAGMGVTLQLISEPEEERDPRLSARVREAVLAAVLTDAHGGGDARVSSHANALRALLSEGEAGRALSPGEAMLLDELLARMARASDR
ncbi:AcrR family transcriptional regulator [Nocardiopsis arvandica]|uniref:AcrR family transcriptional regulator n=1 Tax=Nocardiopsis sinuspersici TaxID=501010 RepID=A0A7Y9XI57_9ACTN|nr:TetR/AcrR family transcriptional regulator [Nocardiopsis sinuspersici]NYH54890.1 AcrR family transcriptional regulator [Nocardiopsis sinuspersici]